MDVVKRDALKTIQDFSGIKVAGSNAAAAANSTALRPVRPVGEAAPNSTKGVLLFIMSDVFVGVGLLVVLRRLKTTQLIFWLKKRKAVWKHCRLQTTREEVDPRNYLCSG